MSQKKPRQLRQRPVYLIVPDRQGSWCVQHKGDSKPIGTYKTKAEARRHAEEQAAKHLVAQIVVYKRDGSFEKEYALFNEERTAKAKALLEERLSRFRNRKRAEAVLVNGSYAENVDVVIDGETVRLSIVIHEGSSWDEIYVSGTIWDEFLGPPIAEEQFVHLDP